MKDFDEFMSQLQETNQTLDFFCDFDKIAQNVENIKLSLCMLNSLIGSDDMRKSVETIWNRDKSAFDVMDILIAVRSEGKKKVLNSIGKCIVMDSLFESVDGVMEFLENTVGRRTSGWTFCSCRGGQPGRKSGGSSWDRRVQTSGSAGQLPSSRLWPGTPRWCRSGRRW